MTIHARFLPKYPKRIQVTDGLTKTEANGVVTLGFDYVNSEFGAELQQTVDATAANAALTAADRTAVAADLVSANAAAATATSAVSLFGTKALAAATNPIAASSFILTEGVSAVGDSGPVVYKNNGTTTGDLVITLSDGTTLVGYDVAGPVINAAGCGLSPSATGAVNLAALKKAVSLCPVGGTVWAPPLVGACTVDTSGGLSDAVLINKTITFINDANLKMSTSAQDTVGFNPSYMFKVTGENVKFCASMGSIEGDGTTFINEPSGDEGHCPGLIYVLAGHGFEFHSTLIKPPQIGIYARNTDNCNFDDTHIIGGHVGYEPSTIVDPGDPNFGDANPAYLGSYHIGITLSGGDNHSFVGFKTSVGDDGGAVAQGIFSSGAGGICNDIKIVNATADRPWEKLCYLYGDRHRVLGCTVHGTFSVNQQTSVFSDAIRLEGNDGLAFGNVVHDAASGIQVADGTDNRVLNNALLNISGVGIAVQQLTTGKPVSGNKVRGNRVTHNGTSTVTGPGVFVYSSLGDMFQPDVSDNYVLGYGEAETYGAIHIEAASPYNVYQPVARDNTVTSYTTGIKIKRGITINVNGTDLRSGTAVGILIDSCGSGVVSNSRGVSVGAWALACDSSSDVEFEDNAALGPTTNGIRGITSGAVSVSGCYGRGNRYTSEPLTGTALLSSLSASTQVTHGGIAPNALIQIIPVSGAFAIKNAVDGYYSGTNGNDFNVVNANGNTAAGTEKFGYQVIQ
jgi:hypothetical protein